MWKKVFLFLAISLVLFGCSTKNEKAGTTAKDTSTREAQANGVRFENLDMEVNDGIAVLQGEVHANETNVFYQLEHEGESLSDETALPLEKKKGQWEKFMVEVELPEETLNAEEPPVIVIYGKNHDGEKINPNYFPVDVENK
ncbi:hypothetical protein [Virgibacillus sp. Bac330]|uniref:hypothetical protein n=1 Tax=Virgibacillus sp. Bac330 TaxID=2419841 RepID=UPI000EF4B161|nr:hypothetical protein [Virgibacillus sp. Bac330]